MIARPKVVVIIPAYNEENSIAKVIADIPAGLVHEVVVVNNNSNDDTEVNARDAGATVLREKRPGYGYACLKGIEYIK
nr:glycosyltransferase [Segetibacter sp.]